MIALAKNIIKTKYSQDVSNSVLRIKQQASNGINPISENQCDDVLTLTNIDYLEYEDGDLLENFRTHTILTFLDDNNQEIVVVVETEESFEKAAFYLKTLIKQMRNLFVINKK